MSRQTDGTTGRLLEREVLGTCFATAEGYLPWNEAVRTVLHSKKPPLKTPFVARLERAVSAEVGRHVGVHSAVGSALDHYHGCDALVVDGFAVVTLDLTMNPNKGEGDGKANVIIRREDLADVPVLAGMIARQLRAQNLKLSGRV